MVDVIGWAVVASGLVAGALLFRVVVRRSRGVRWVVRAPVIALGLTGMAVVWTGGLALAVAFFFLRC